MPLPRIRLSSVLWSHHRCALWRPRPSVLCKSYAASFSLSATATESQRSALPAVPHPPPSAHPPHLREHLPQGAWGGLRAQRCQPCTPTSSQSQAATSFKTTNIGGYRGLHTLVSGSQARVVIPTADSTMPTHSPSRASQDGACA